MTEDFTTMNNPKFIALAELTQPFPDWVVKEAMPESQDFEKRAATAFADPGRRLLPICTKSAAFHSALNIFARPDDYDEPTLERVKQACHFYDIEDDILPYAHIFVEEVEKSASLNEIPEGTFAINEVVGDEDFKLLPLNDREDVIDSAWNLAKMATENRIHHLMVVPAARKITKAAADLGVPEERLSQLVNRLGSAIYPDAEKSAKLIEGRERSCRDPELRPHLAADYKEALANVEEDPDDALEKIATIDTMAGINPNYRLGAPTPTPFDVVFCGITEAEVEKAAKEQLLVREVLVPIHAVRKIPELKATFHMSKAAAETLSKLRDEDDARPLSAEIENWDEKDQRTLLRLAVEAA